MGEGSVKIVVACNLGGGIKDRLTMCLCYWLWVCNRWMQMLDVELSPVSLETPLPSSSASVHEDDVMLSGSDSDQ